MGKWDGLVETAPVFGSDFPGDLRQALSELLVQKFIGAEQGGTVLTRVKAGAYEEWYDVNDAQIAADILEVVDSYSLPLFL